MMVLWLLMLRGIGIELRSHIDSACGSGSSTLSSGRRAFCWRSSSARRWAMLSAAFRSTPTATSSCRCGPTGASARRHGILDWYTVLCGVVALVTLVVHGSLYLATKTQNELNVRARKSRFMVLAGPGAADHLQPDRNRLRRAPCAGELFENGHSAIWFRRSLIGSLVLHVFCTFARAGERRISGVLHIHCGHAGGCGVCTLS